MIAQKEFSGGENVLEDCQESSLACGRDGVYFGVKSSTGEIIVGDRGGSWLTRTVRSETERRDRYDLNMVVGVPWRKNDEDPKVDDENLQDYVVVMDSDYMDNLETEEYVPCERKDEDRGDATNRAKAAAWERE